MKDIVLGTIIGLGILFLILFVTITLGSWAGGQNDGGWEHFDNDIKFELGIGD